MQIHESEWLRDQMAKIPDGDLFPLLDVGSSTLDFRTRVQPYIEANLFEPLRARRGRVIHLDIKDSPGVDVVGDLLDPEFCEQLAAMNVRSVMLANVLHHLVDPRPLTSAVARLVPSGGHIIVSGPNRYPVHHDPIDTMLRPSPEEVAEFFPGSEMVASAIIDAGNWRQWNKSERGGRTLPRALARLCVPIYRPAKWWELARQSPYILKHIKAFAVVLRKQ